LYKYSIGSFLVGWYIWPDYVHRHAVLLCGATIHGAVQHTVTTIHMVSVNDKQIRYW